jgi:predicted nucleotidyltransferase
MATRRNAEAVVAVKDPMLVRIIDRLVTTYRPERIYLFGSRARAGARSDSDYDLMVIVPDTMPAARRRGARAYEALWGLNTAVDVLVWTRDAFDKRLHLRASLPSTVVRDGKLVYSA